MTNELRLLDLSQGQCLAALGEHDGLLTLLGLARSNGWCQRAAGCVFLEFRQHEGILLVSDGGIGVGLDIGKALFI